MRTVEQKGRHDNIKALTGFRAHGVRSAHHTRWSGQRRTGCITENFAGFDQRRFTYDTCGADFLDLAAAVSDLPKPIRDGEILIALIVNLDGIGPDETRVSRAGLFRQKFRFDTHNDVIRALLIESCAALIRRMTVPVLLSLAHAPLRYATFEISKNLQIPCSPI